MGWQPTAPGLARSVLRMTIPVEYRLRLRRSALDTAVVSEILMTVDGRLRTAHVSRRTQLVIDAPARSGNSYARAAFQYANGTGVLIATHGHTHRMMVRGARLHLPTIVLLRDPRDVLASAMAYEPGVPALLTARAYRRYYEEVLPLLEHILVAPFERVTSDFGDVIVRCNERFGTPFIPYQATKESEAAIAESIDGATKLVVRPEHFDAVVSRPSSGRLRSRALLEKVDHDTQAELDSCVAVYLEVRRRARLDEWGDGPEG
jgi:hypothetical protein